MKTTGKLLMRWVIYEFFFFMMLKCSSSDYHTVSRVYADTILVFEFLNLWNLLTDEDSVSILHPLERRSKSFSTTNTKVSQP